MKSSHTLNRRDAIRAGATALASLVIARSAHAEELVSVTDPTAIALGYVEDAATVDVEKWPKKAGPGGAEQQCTNCSLYADKGDGVGTCAIFPGKWVKGAGWCSGWVAG